MYIIVCPYGSPGDVVSAVIDSSDVNLFTDGENIYMTFDHKRKQALVGNASHPSRNLLEEADALEGICKSLYTHTSKRKIEKTKVTKHTYISLDCSSEKASNWVFARSSKELNDDAITPKSIMNNSIVNNYHADHVITLEDILDGRLVEKLKEFITDPLDEDLYKAWMSPSYCNFKWD